MNRFAVVALAALTMSACVKKGVHEEIVADWAARVAAVEEARDACSAELMSTQTTLAETERVLEMTRAELQDCRTQLEDARDLIDQGDEAQRALAARLEELAAIEAELRARDAIFQDIVHQFQELIRNGYVEVAIERGRLVIKMPQDILFESGSADVGPDGQSALTEVGVVLATLRQRQFQVEGHTDNVPIETRRFPSNWELSAARALAVVHLFEEVGVPGANLSAGAFGEYQPRAANDTPENKALNRRIEIVMVPDLEAIFGGIAPTAAQ